MSLQAAALGGVSGGPATGRRLPPAAALPPADGAALPVPLLALLPLLHAANASMLTAASALILCSFIQFLLQITGRNPLARTVESVVRS